MKLILLICSLHYLTITINCYKLYNAVDSAKENSKNVVRYKKQQTGDGKHGNSLQDISRDEREEDIEKHAAEDGGDDSDKRLLEEAKRQMLDEIRSIRKTLKRKMEVYFRSIYPYYRKSDLCLSNMANGVEFDSINYQPHDWRMIIRGALSMAHNIVKTALGPFAGPPKAALRSLARLTNIIGRKRNDYLQTTVQPVAEISTLPPWESTDKRTFVDDSSLPRRSRNTGEGTQQLDDQLQALLTKDATGLYYNSNIMHEDLFTQEMLIRFVQEFCDEDVFLQ